MKSNLNKLKSNKSGKAFITILALIVIISIVTGVFSVLNSPTVSGEIKRFTSDQELIQAFNESRNTYKSRGIGMGTVFKANSVEMAMEATTAAPDSSGATDYSTTNIQVQGVDEADILKNDDTYIYLISQGKLIITQSYPPEDAEVLSTTNFNNFYPQEMFIDNSRLIVFGRASYQDTADTGTGVMADVEYSPQYSPHYRRSSFASVRIYDISDRADPGLIKTYDFEGSYLSSRKIGEHVYFVVNSYPHYNDRIIPLYREDSEDFKVVAESTDIGYFEPVQVNSFMTIVSVSMQDEDKMEKEVVASSGQEVYASLDNLYLVRSIYPHTPLRALGEVVAEEEVRERTAIHKFNLDDGEIKFIANGEVPGRILNQFSMDEYQDNFRIATTIGHVSRMSSGSVNNLYVLDEELDIIGSVEDLAPGERIYSARFMGQRAYLVTFKKIDPLFVIDLSQPTNPRVLGKLKIPGYSDYLHPYDGDHIIGIGKDTVEAEEGDFAWYQGVKIALFDVSDVENPIEKDKLVIGDRGTDSEVLRNHKAFLFDKERELMVLPINLAEIQGEKTRDNQHGSFVYQGAYVYKVDDDGFKLRGRVTHYDDDEVFMKSGYYFRGESNVKRSLYMDSVLYTISDQKIKMNSLVDLDEINVLEIG